jgi:hypothetical protein
MGRVGAERPRAPAVGRRRLVVVDAPIQALQAQAGFDGVAQMGRPFRRRCSFRAIRMKGHALRPPGVAGFPLRSLRVQ